MEQIPQQNNNTIDQLPSHNKKRFIQVGVGVFIVVIILITFSITIRSSSNQEENQLQKAPLPEISKGPMGKTPFTSMDTDTSIDTFKNTPFTEPSEKIKTTNGKEIYIYKVKIQEGTVTPKEIIIKKNQLAQILFSASDTDYDLVFPKEMGIYGFVKKDQESPVVISTQTIGIFPFTCEKVCPHNIKGTFIIKE